MVGVFKAEGGVRQYGRPVATGGGSAVGAVEVLAADPGAGWAAADGQPIYDDGTTYPALAAKLGISRLTKQFAPGTANPYGGTYPDVVPPVLAIDPNDGRIICLDLAYMNPVTGKKSLDGSKSFTTISPLATPGGNRALGGTPGPGAQIQNIYEPRLTIGTTGLWVFHARIQTDFYDGAGDFSSSSNAYIFAYSTNSGQGWTNTATGYGSPVVKVVWCGSLARFMLLDNAGRLFTSTTGTGWTLVHNDGDYASGIIGIAWVGGSHNRFYFWTTMSTGSFCLTTTPQTLASYTTASNGGFNWTGSNNTDNVPDALEGPFLGPLGRVLWGTRYSVNGTTVWIAIVRPNASSDDYFLPTAGQKLGGLWGNTSVVYMWFYTPSGVTGPSDRPNRALVTTTDYVTFSKPIYFFSHDSAQSSASQGFAFSAGGFRWHGGQRWWLPVGIIKPYQPPSSLGKGYVRIS